MGSSTLKDIVDDNFFQTAIIADMIADGNGLLVCPVSAIRPDIMAAAFAVWSFYVCSPHFSFSSSRRSEGLI